MALMRIGKRSPGGLLFSRHRRVHGAGSKNSDAMGREGNKEEQSPLLFDPAVLDGAVGEQIYADLDRFSHVHPLAFLDHAGRGIADDDAGRSGGQCLGCGQDDDKDNEPK